MSDTEFWTLLDAVRAAQPEAPAQWLAEQLGRDPARLMAFDRCWLTQVDAAYNWQLWAAAYVLQGGCSDDGFWEFRNGLIGMGREAYEAITRNPDAIVDWFEDEDDYFDKTEALAELSYELQPVWRTLTGAGEDDYFEHGLALRNTPTGTAWSSGDDEEAVLRTMLPRAVAQYWDGDGVEDGDEGEEREEREEGQGD